MATEREIKKLLRPLLARHEDLALVGRLIVVKPLHHHLRGVLVDRRSWADALVPGWYVYHLFDPGLAYFLSWGDELNRPAPGGWTTKDPRVSEELCNEIEVKALPILRRIVSFEDFVNVISKGKTLPGRTLPQWILFHPDHKMLINIALGNLDTAQELCLKHFSRPLAPTPRDADVTKRRYAGINRIRELLAENDRAGLIALLHEWEAATVKRLKLEPYWEPTPFPIELKQ
jgi:hypothetical protein